MSKVDHSDTVFVPYHSILSHTFQDFKHDTVQVGTVVLVQLESKAYRCAFVSHKIGGIIVDLIEEFDLI